MGFRFRKSIRIAPGVRINLSKSGVSTSIGGKGLTVNSRGRVTASVPGTGLSYTSTIGRGAGRRSGSSQASSNTSAQAGCGCLLLMLVPVVFVAPWILLILIPVGIFCLVAAQLADQASKAVPTTAIKPQGSRGTRPSASEPSQARDLPSQQSGSATLRIPPPPPLPQLDSLPTLGSENANFQDIADQDYQIVYVDANGNRTERKITIDRIENGYVYAFCHLRNDERTFLWSRMEQCVNCISGEVLKIAGEDVSRDGLPADDEFNEYQNSDLDASIGVLLYLGKGDRRLMQHERDILIRVYGLLCGESGLTPDQISTRIDYMNTPSRTRYKVLVSQVKMADPEVRRIVLDSADALFSKRKKLNPVETDAMDTLKSNVMRD